MAGRWNQKKAGAILEAVEKAVEKSCGNVEKIATKKY